MSNTANWELDYEYCCKHKEIKQKDKKIDITDSDLFQYLKKVQTHNYSQTRSSHR